MMQFFFSVIYWDPDPNLFIIPYINHPLKWYGLLFMGGMVAGFFILLPLVRQRLMQLPLLPQRNIKSWAEVQKELSKALQDTQNPLHETLVGLDKKQQQQIQSLQEPSKGNLELLLKRLSSFDRSRLEQLFPAAFHSSKELAFKYADGLLWWIIAGTIIGARLGHVFFYEWPYYSHNPEAILKIWEGGLASHGGTIGVLLAIYFYSLWNKKEFPEFSFLALGDLLTIPTAFAVIFIRLGNFVNQEILGTPSNLPWAVIFGRPVDGGALIPRHPVQLYEAFAYLITFILLKAFWKAKKGAAGQGFMLGLFFICVFGSRFFLEFFKTAQASSVMDESVLQMGQILSLPFIALGIALIYYSQLRRSYDTGSRQPQQSNR